MQTLAQLKAGELAGTKRLQLSESLTEFPMEILTLANSLEVLDLSNNKLSAIPAEIATLPHLKIVFASNNLFKVFPSALGLCPELEMIGFKSNQITTVPEDSLPLQLRWLILTDNKITTLPETLGHRPRLEKLALAGNKLTHLPNSFSQLTKLALLRISANQLSAFPTQLLPLPNLAWLAFSGNPFCQTDLHIDSIPEIASSDYDLQEVLGQGASGIIYKAQLVGSSKTLDSNTSVLPEQIAVKVFKGEVTSDGYPKDELQACLKTGSHPHLVKSAAQVKEANHLALIMELIPPHFKNLGLPPSLQTCSRDTFPNDFVLSINHIEKIVEQMQQVFEHLHDNHVSHGDLYAHNTLFDEDANILFGDFGAASMYHMLPTTTQSAIKKIEQRALYYFIADLLSVCSPQDKASDTFQKLQRLITA